MLATGTLIDERYELIEQIGEGGFGAVYKAHQLQLDRVVALKMLNTTVLYERDGLARFEREAKLINALKHKNIVGVYGYGVWEQAPYMVMEFVDGKPLTKLISAGRMEPARAVSIIAQVFEALACAHATGVVHRDLKPANILVGANDNVKVIDFGLARLMPGYGLPGQKLTETGYTIGTCHYMAPEQALGKAVDQRADIYAAGCIMYQMLTGVVPFDADDSVAIMFKHLQEEPKPLSDVIGTTPQARAISIFVANCMLKDSNDRYQSCDEALDALRKLTAAEYSKVVSCAVPLKRITSRLRSRSPYKLMFAVLAGALALTSIVTVFLSLHEKASVSLAGSAALYHRLVGTPQDQQYTPLQHVFEMDLRDHQLTKCDRLDLLYRLLVLHSEQNMESIDQYIDKLLTVRGELASDPAPPRDCRAYTDGDFSRLLLGSNSRYMWQADLFAQTAVRQGFGETNGHYSLVMIEWLKGNMDKAISLATENLGESEVTNFRLARYVLNGQYKEAAQYSNFLNCSISERELWAARIAYANRNFHVCLRNATAAMSPIGDSRVNAALAARYRLAAAHELGRTRAEEDPDGSVRNVADLLPGLVPAYPMQMFDRDVSVVYRQMK